MAKSRERLPSLFSTKPTAATKASMMWIFYSGVTISSCRPMVLNRSRPKRALSSEPRPKASSMTTKWNARERNDLVSMPNW